MSVTLRMRLLKPASNALSRATLLQRHPFQLHEAHDWLRYRSQGMEAQKRYKRGFVVEQGVGEVLEKERPFNNVSVFGRSAIEDDSLEDTNIRAARA